MHIRFNPLRDYLNKLCKQKEVDCYMQDCLIKFKLLSDKVFRELI